MATCQQCQQIFGRTNSLTRHLREKHGQNQIRTNFAQRPLPDQNTIAATSKLNTTKLSRCRPIRAPFAQTRFSSARTTYENTCKVALAFKRSSIKANRLQRIFPTRRHWTKRATYGDTCADATKHRTRRAACNAIFSARGHWTKRAVCDRSTFPAARGHWTERAVCERSTFPAGNRTFWLDGRIF